MTVLLSYDSQLSRVRITADGLPPAPVTVERSIDQVRWTTVRGGAALTPVNGEISLDDYEFAADIENFYRVSPTAPGLVLDGVAGNYASTPDHASLDITGDLDVRADVTPDTWRPTGTRNIAAKYSTGDNQRSWRLALLSNGRLELRWSTDGTASTAAMSTEVIPESSGRLAVRAELAVAGWSVVFWTGPSIDGPWTQFGSPVTGGTATSIHAGTAALEAGSINGGASELLAGVIHRLQLRDGGASGTLVADPNFAGQLDGTTSFTDSAGRLWTVHGSARIYGAQTASVTPVLDTVWLKSIARPYLNRPLPRVLDVSAIQRQSRSGVFEIVGRSRPVVVGSVRGSRRWTLTVLTEGQSDAEALDLMLASGDPLFIQVPPGSSIPGGYVTAEDTAEQRYPDMRDPREPRVFTLPLIECAPPGPDVVGATATCQTVLDLYATCADVLAAHATCAELLDLIADPSEVIVP